MSFKLQSSGTSDKPKLKVKDLKDLKDEVTAVRPEDNEEGKNTQLIPKVSSNKAPFTTPTHPSVAEAIRKRD